jgi:hypothetical protein
MAEQQWMSDCCPSTEPRFSFQHPWLSSGIPQSSVTPTLVDPVSLTTLGSHTQIISNFNSLLKTTHQHSLSYLKWLSNDFLFGIWNFGIWTAKNYIFMMGSLCLPVYLYLRFPKRTLTICYTHTSVEGEGGQRVGRWEGSCGRPQIHCVDWGRFELQSLLPLLAEITGVHHHVSLCKGLNPGLCAC